MSNVPINQQAQDHKKKRISFDLSLEGEINAAPLTESLVMPQQTVTQEPVQQQVTTPKLYYEEMAERIEKKQYNRKVFIKWKREQSSQMQAVTGALKGLTKLLDTPVGEVDFDTVRTQYWSLMKSCDDYLNSHNPGSDEGQARYAMVEQIKSHIMTEMKTIDGNSKTVSQQDLTEGKKWRDMLIGVPVISVTQDKVHVLEEQGQASEVKRIEVGDKQYFYKKRDKMALKGKAGDEGSKFTGTFSEVCKEFTDQLAGLRDRENPAYKGMPEAERAAKIHELEESLKGALKLADAIPEIAIKQKIKGAMDNIRYNEYQKAHPNGILLKTNDKGEVVQTLEDALKNLDEEIAQYRRDIDHYNQLISKYPAVIDPELKVIIEETEIQQYQIQQHFFPELAGEEKRKALAPEELESMEQQYGEFMTQLAPILKEMRKKNVALSVGQERARLSNGADFTARNVATSVLADYLKIQGLVVDSRIAELEVNGQRETGLFMSEAKGITGEKLLYGGRYPGKTVHLTTQAIKQLMSLQVFDYICGQVDRHMNNFLMDVEEVDGKVMIKGITGIDNDLSFGKLTPRGIEHGHLNGADTRIKPLEAGGEPLLMGIDKAFADRIIAIEPEEVQYLLKPFLEDEAIRAALGRLKAVKQFLQSEEGQKRLIGSDEQEKWEAIRVSLDKPKVGEETQAQEREYFRFAEKVESSSYVDSFMLGRQVTK